MRLDIFNGFEAALWFAMAIAVVLYHRRTPHRTRRIGHGTAVFLALFAASDLIEMQSAAWWRPTGLLILKGVCVVGLASGFGLLLRRSS